MSNDKTPAEAAADETMLRDIIAEAECNSEGDYDEWLMHTARAAFLAGQASQGSAAMSKDYDKLYDRLKAGGGDVIAKVIDKGVIKYGPFGKEYVSTTRDFYHFKRECIELQLEWIAPAPVGPTIDQIMEVFRKWYYDELTQWDVDDDDILRKRLSSLFR